MESVFDTQTCVDEAGHPLTFAYILLQDELPDFPSFRADYGIKIRSSSGEEVAIPHITPDRKRLEQLLNLLCEQNVSPIHLRDIIDDWL